jgi:hypothetical protein
MLICRYACTLFVATLTAPVVMIVPMAPVASALYTSQNTVPAPENVFAGKDTLTIR